MRMKQLAATMMITMAMGGCVRQETPTHVREQRDRTESNLREKTQRRCEHGHTAKIPVGKTVRFSTWWGKRGKVEPVAEGEILGQIADVDVVATIRGQDMPPIETKEGVIEEFEGIRRGIFTVTARIDNGTKVLEVTPPPLEPGDMLGFRISDRNALGIRVCDVQEGFVVLSYAVKGGVPVRMFRLRAPILYKIIAGTGQNEREERGPGLY
ncbi:hypothetical protein KKF81_05600 [Candidatus Micrarchaeota archaeon]|nr:hypothetical protein [Candidatus Micrarchaeota archaeon]MBU1166403.1 hypothetical protein [Candidatus Micrarchaeota archaeon]MBU1886914.1 hypothetical protein [Candidatus Micrarchaeota archaeon]